MRDTAQLILLLLPWVVGAAAPRRVPVAFTHVNIVDTKGGATRADQTLLVSGQRIAQVGDASSTNVPADAKVIDARGKYLIPGLWDMHVHVLWEPAVDSTLPLLIANGVTGVRDMHTHFPLEKVKQWEAEVQSGTRIGPRLVYAGHIVDGPQPVWPGSVAVKDVQSGRDAVQDLKSKGAGFVKVYELLPRDAYFAIADEAKKQNVPFAGHVPQSVTPKEAAEAGQHSIEHLSHLLEHCTNSKPNTYFGAITYDPVKGKALMQIFKAQGTWHCPTLVTTEASVFGREDRIANDPRRKYLSPIILSQVGFSNWGRDWDATLHFWKEERRLMRDLYAAGNGILAGTDTPVVQNVPGFTLHDELKCLVDAGLSPKEALAAATWNPARFFGKERELGSVESGKVADLILLAADPLTDIANTTRIEAVVADGRFYGRSDLDKLLNEAERNADQEKHVLLPPSPAPDGTESGVITSAAGEMFYEAKGRGEALVLLHDGLLHRQTWDAQWNELSKKYRLVRYDRRGFGKSPPPVALYADVEDLLALLDHLKIDKAILVGCSAGGSVAVDFALEKPDRVSRLVLEGAVIAGMDFSEHFLRRNATAFAPWRETRDVAATIENWLNDPYLVSRSNVNSREIVARILRANPQDLTSDKEHWRKPSAKEPSVRRLGEIHIPTLILVGEGDIPDVQAQAGALQTGIAGSRRIVVAKSGHLIHLEQPAEFLRQIDEFATAAGKQSELIKNK